MKRLSFMKTIGVALGAWCGIMLQIPAIAGAGESAKIEIVKTSPKYGEEISLPKDLVITIQFNQEMDPSMQDDFVMDQRGVTDEHGDPVEISGQFTWVNPKTLQFKPKQSLKPNATYQVSLFSVRTKEGEEMEEVPFRLAFMTVQQ